MILLAQAISNVVIADEVIDKSGRIYIGNITSMNKEFIEIKTSKNTFKIYSSDIKTINLGDLKPDNSSKSSNGFPFWEDSEPTSIDSSENVEQENIKTDNPTKKTKKTYIREVIIPRGLLIPVSFKQEVKSKNYDAGDLAAIRVVDDVYVDEILVFKKGNIGTARIIKSKNTRFFARTGIIEVNGGEINDKYGNSHAVDIKITKKGKPLHTSGEAISITRNNWPITFFGTTNGKDVQIPSGAVFHAIITEDSIIKIRQKID